MLCLQGRLPLPTHISTLWMPAVSTCNKQTAAAVAHPQAQKWMPLTWDMYVLLLQLMTIAVQLYMSDD